VQDPWGAGTPRRASKGVRSGMRDSWGSPVSKFRSEPARADLEKRMVDGWGSPIYKLRSAPATAEVSRIKRRLMHD